MSLAPKIDEVRCVVTDVNPNLGFFTETWLCDSSNPNNLQIPSNYFIARNRNNGMLNCGVGLYVKHGIQYMTPEHIHNGDFEALWVWLKQLIDRATPGDRTLHLVLKNLASLYHKNSVEILPPFVYPTIILRTPWVTPEFKSLIKGRQEAFTSGDKTRNTVHRQRKILRRRYFESKVNRPKHSKPRKWWSSVKRIAGMIPACRSEGLLSKLTAFRADLCPPQVLANTINAAFLVPMQGFTRL
ncbi:hypothetical protein P5673_018172, partial [Acropora cervicornis]